MKLDADFLQFCMKIYTLICKNQIEQVIHEMISMANSRTGSINSLPEIMIIGINYQQLDKQLECGVMQLSDYQQQRNKLLFQIFRIILDIFKTTD